MELKNNIQTFYAPTRNDWRVWLTENHQTEKSVWLIIYKKESNTKSIYYPEAVDEALCFGWIDSSIAKRDAESYYQFFAKRNPKSNWSKVNKDKIIYLTAQNLMTASGLVMVTLAKNTGTWDALDDVENLILPKDLAQVFEVNKMAFEHWQKLSRSTKRGTLEWLLMLKEKIHAKIALKK